MEQNFLARTTRAQNLEYQLFQKLRDETLREIGQFSDRGTQNCGGA